MAYTLGVTHFHHLSRSAGVFASPSSTSCGKMLRYDVWAMEHTSKSSIILDPDLSRPTRQSSADVVSDRDRE